MSNRIIYEIGLLNEGFSVVRKQNINTSDLSQNPILVGELLSVIQGYSMETSNEIPELFQIENFVICLQRFKCGGESSYYLLYAISQLRTKYIKKMLENLARELKTYDTILLSWNTDTESLRNLNPIFDELFLQFSG
jgi:hypothetical protein